MIPTELIPSFLFYAFISGITPGPANLSSLSVALNYGKKSAIRQWYGIFTGYTIVSISSVFVCYFIGTTFERYVRALSFIGLLYMVWLAFKQFREAFVPQEIIGDEARQGKFTTGVLIQLTNVKIMIYCITAISIYSLPYNKDFFSIFLCGLILPLTGPICNLAWICAGVFLRKIFGKYSKSINILMGLSLLFCAASIIMI